MEPAFKFACVGKTGGFDAGERGGGMVWNPKLEVDDSEANAGCSGSVIADGKDQKIFWGWWECVRDPPWGCGN